MADDAGLVVGAAAGAVTGGIPGAVFGMARGLWHRTRTPSLGDGIWYIGLACLLGLVVSSTARLAYDFWDDWDREILRTPEALKEAGTCAFLARTNSYMSDKMRGDCRTANQTVSKSPLRRALDNLTPSIPTFTSTGELVRTMAASAWQGVRDVWETNKITFTVCILAMLGIGQPIMWSIDRCLRDRANKRRAKQTKAWHEDEDAQRALRKVYALGAASAAGSGSDVVKDKTL